MPTIPTTWEEVPIKSIKTSWDKVRGRQVRGKHTVWTDPVLKKATRHVFRHTTASHLVQQRIDPMDVAKVLGHTNDRMVREVYGKLHPDFQKNTAMAITGKRDRVQNQSSNTGKNR